MKQNQLHTVCMFVMHCCSTVELQHAAILIKTKKNQCSSTERKPCNVCVRKGVDVLNALPPAKFPLFVAEGYSILFYSPWSVWFPVVAAVDPGVTRGG